MMAVGRTPHLSVVALNTGHIIIGHIIIGQLVSVEGQRGKLWFVTHLEAEVGGAVGRAAK